ncbi:MAG: hypothetical protein BGO39_20440 [Chloroflexi bacterium 54-19]|nr:MAG: hypothetical protein BGO39_20440 [Chloroflexi bacterium 54-19]
MAPSAYEELSAFGAEVKLFFVFGRRGSSSGNKLLGLGSGFLLQLHTPHEAVYLTGGVNDTLLTGIEGVAMRAKFDFNRPFAGRAGFVGSATGAANNVGFHVAGVKTLFHFLIYLSLYYAGWLDRRRGFRSGGFHRVNADAFFIFTIPFKFDRTGDSSKDGVVAAQADIFARFEFGAALADQDIPAFNQFTLEFFDAKHFGLAIAPVA